MIPYPKRTGPTLYVIICLTTIFCPRPSSCRLAPPHFITKRDSSGDDDLRKELETRAEKFTVERYDSDPILLQSVDTVNEKSGYKDPQTDMEYYERGHSDRNKAAVVLSGEEDKLPTTSGDKRVYVVMRMSNLDGKPKKYYPSIAYLVDPDPGHASTDIVESKGKKYAVEWAVWNDGVLHGFKYSFQFAVCRYSVIIPCKPDLLTGNSTAATGAGASGKTETTTPKPVEKVEEKYPQNEYSDFFLDLDNNKMSGRFQLIGMAFDFLNKAVDGVGSLWCGLSGMILGQCHQYDPKDGYTKSQIGSPVIRSDGKIMAAGASDAFGSDGILGTVINSVFHGNKDVPTHLLDAPPPGDVPIGPQTDDQTILLNVGPPPEGRKKREASAAGPRMKGWRTQYAKTIEPNIIFDKEKDIFYGIGHCPSALKNLTELYNAATTDELIINFYMVLLRNGCISRVKMVIPALKSEGILEYKDKLINVVAGNKLVTESKLSWVEEQKLASAFELNAISDAFKESKDKPEAEPKNPFDQKITNSAKFLERFSMNYISISKSKGTKHYIRLLRHLVQVLRSAMERLAEDSRNLDECTGDCSKDIEILASDKLTVMGIIKFIMHGFPLKDDQVYVHFKEFMTNNRASIEAALKESHV